LSFSLHGYYAPGTGTGTFLVTPLALATNNVTWSATAIWDGGGSPSVELDSSPVGKEKFTAVAETVYYSPSGYTNTFTPSTSDIYNSSVFSGASGMQLTNYVVTNRLSYYPTNGDGFNRM